MQTKWTRAACLKLRGTAHRTLWTSSNRLAFELIMEAVCLMFCCLCAEFCKLLIVLQRLAPEAVWFFEQFGDELMPDRPPPADVGTMSSQDVFKV